MKPYAKWAAAGGAILVALAVLVPAVVYLASEAVIVRRYTLSSSIVRAATRSADIARGAHLATIFGCRDCHGGRLRGRLMYVAPGLRIGASNLRRFAARHTTADFDRAVRHGLAPSARALWVMPSASYVYMRDRDLAAILGYLRSLPADGPSWPPPHFGFRARLAVLEGSLAPVDPYDLGRTPPRNVGPRYDGGRYLAAMACSGCHATDLSGTDAAPGLKSVTAYSQSQFFALMRDGRALPGHQAPEMAHLAKVRFKAFEDYQIIALYAYLVQRAKTVDLDHAH